MKKVAEKVALIAQICITLIFVLICVLIVSGVIKITDTWYENNGFVVVIIIIFAVAYLGLSLYMIYMHFAETNVLKQVLLYSYSDSTVKATSSVVKRIARNSGKLVEGVKIRSIQIRPDDKYGLKMRVTVSIKADNAEFCIDKLRVVLSDSFKNILGIKFSNIDFKITFMRTEYKPDLEKAQEIAVKLESERKTEEQNQPQSAKPVPAADKSEDIYEEASADEDESIKSETDDSTGDDGEKTAEAENEIERRNLLY